MPLPFEAQQDPVWRRIDSEWKPIPKSPGYAVGLVLLGAAIVVMPILYMAIVAGAGYGVYWYITEGMPGAPSARGRAALFLDLMRFAPVIAGAALVLFLLKPLLAPRRRHGEEIVLERFEEPELHAFVDNVCGVIGAPAPKSIHLDCDINASAGFRAGVLSLLRRGDVVLTIGMPLVAGMSKREFAGILAHEFGHFAQGTGMRATYLGRTVVGWFFRAAYERDGWDEMLAQAGRSGGWVAPVALLVRLCVWLARLLIMVIAWAGAALCSFMLRRMEYDADRYEARLCGAGPMTNAFQRLAELAEAYPRAMEDSFRGWQREKKLPNNFPALVADYSRRLTPETREELGRRMRKDSGLGIFATHPSARARIRAAEALNEPGLITDEASARTLFGDFTSASIKATYGHWRGYLGPWFKSVTLIDTFPLLKMTGKEESRQGAVAAYLGFEPPTWRPLFPPFSSVPHVEDMRPVLERLKRARAKIRLLVEGPPAKVIGAAVSAFREAQAEAHKWETARAIMDAGVKVDYEAIGLDEWGTTRAGISEAIDRHSNKAIGACGAIDEATEVAVERLRAALSLVGARGIERLMEEAGQARARADELLAALAAHKEMYPFVKTARLHTAVINAAGATVKNQATLDKAKKLARPASDALRNDLDAARRIGGGARDPLAGEEIESNLGEAIVGASPGWREIDEIVAAGGRFVDNWADHYRRTLGELVQVAEKTERAVAAAAKERREAVKQQG